VIKDSVGRLHERQNTQERREENRERLQEHETILDWLTPFNYATQQSDLINWRQKGLGSGF
jgi:hypothetical protein